MDSLPVVTPGRTSPKGRADPGPLSLVTELWGSSTILCVYRLPSTVLALLQRTRWPMPDATEVVTAWPCSYVSQSACAFTLPTAWPRVQCSRRRRLVFWVIVSGKSLEDASPYSPFLGPFGHNEGRSLSSIFLVLERLLPNP